LVDLGVDSYRPSVSWLRVSPRDADGSNDGDPYLPQAGSLRENGTDPFLTLYHWDLPQALEDDGGWRNRAMW
jgi:beta-glucosidase